MNDTHLAPVCPHCGEQDCLRPRMAVCGYYGSDLTVEGAHGRHASAREDYLTDLVAEREEQVEAAREEVRAEFRARVVAVSRLACYRRAIRRANESVRMYREIANDLAREARGLMPLDCGQDGVCAWAPGCMRHWEERNRELIAERDSLHLQRDEARAEVAHLRQRVLALETRIRELGEVTP